MRILRPVVWFRLLHHVSSGIRSAGLRRYAYCKAALLGHFSGSVGTAIRDAWQVGDLLFARTGEENSPYLPSANRISLNEPAIGGVFFSV